MALTEDENRTLTQVGPGTSMGDLLRRYWYPVAAAAELAGAPVRPLRLLGEDLVLYRDDGGAYGLVRRWCAHRGTDLSRGFVEAGCLRCPRHGWLYDRSGNCLDQPLEPEPFLVEIKLPAYAAQEKAGLVWAYLGPSPAPLIPDWEPFSREGTVRQIVFAVLPCSWLQCQESSLDAVVPDEPGDDPNLTKYTSLGFEELVYGFVCRDTLSAADAPANRVSLWPNGEFSGDERSCRFDWRVPLDDTTTLSVSYLIDSVSPGAEPPAGERLFSWWTPLRDDSTGDWITSHTLNRRFAIWVHQGEIADRTREHLSESDRGVVLLRNRYFSQIELMRDGGEPKWVLRRAIDNRRLALPGSGSRPAPGTGTRPPFRYAAGQPPEAAAAYESARESWDQ